MNGGAVFCGIRLARGISGAAGDRARARARTTRLFCRHTSGHTCISGLVVVTHTREWAPVEDCTTHIPVTGLDSLATRTQSTPSTCSNLAAV